MAITHDMQEELDEQDFTRNNALLEGCRLWKIFPDSEPEHDGGTLHIVGKIIGECEWH
jgi:hypothetical protein